MIVGAVVYWNQRGNALDAPWKAEAIKDPVYLEVRVIIDAGSRSIESVALAETTDAQDCRQFSDKVMPMLARAQKESAGPKITVKSQECKAELSPRYKMLFDNEPSFLTYVSAARGARSEREMRFIYWGVSVEESDLVCGALSGLKRNWKGEVSCIKALRT